MTRRTKFGTLTDVRGVRVGHSASPDGSTGVTAILFDSASRTAVDVRGGASATYDTASLDLDATFGRRWAIFFAGGSLFGLDAARGIRTRILEEGGGHYSFGNANPIAPLSGATLFDLPRRLGLIPDYLPLGYEAARVASKEAVAPGPAGAGSGATIGKYLGRDFAMRGGVGSSAAALGSGTSVGVLVVLNSVGAIRDPTTGDWVAGARDRRGRIHPPTAKFGRRSSGGRSGLGTNLVATVTDLPCDRATLKRVAINSQVGLARVVSPVNTATDGDVAFAVSTGKETHSLDSPLSGEIADRIGTRAAELVVVAALQAARSANP